MTIYTIIAGEDDFHNALYKDGTLLYAASEDYLSTETLYTILPKIDPAATIDYLQLSCGNCERLFEELYDYPTDLATTMTYEPETIGVYS